MAAHFTSLQVEYIDGVTGVDEKTLPPHPDHVKSGAAMGSWRSHMNALRTVIEQNISSALIMKDDVDWDIRIKSQMSSFAKASRLLLEPEPGTNDRFRDPTDHSRNGYESAPELDISRETTLPTSSSPY